MRAKSSKQRCPALCIPVPLVSTVSTIGKFQAGRLKSDKRKDEDQHQDFSKEQGIFQYHGIGCKKT